MRVQTFALAVALTALACLPAWAPPKPQDPFELALGCYTIQFGAWSGPLPNPSSVQPDLPTGFRLERPRWRGAYKRVAFDSTPGRARPPVGGWVSLGTDSLLMAWGNEMRGFLLVLTGRDSLHGKVKAAGDFLRAEDPVAPVTAARVACAPSRREGAT